MLIPELFLTAEARMRSKPANSSPEVAGHRLPACGSAEKTDSLTQLVSIVTELRFQTSRPEYASCVAWTAQGAPPPPREAFTQCSVRSNLTSKHRS